MVMLGRCLMQKGDSGTYHVRGVEKLRVHIKSRLVVSLSIILRGLSIKVKRKENEAYHLCLQMQHGSVLSVLSHRNALNYLVRF